MPRPSDILCRRFGRAVRERRLELGLTQEALAVRAKLNRSYITDVERGARNIALVNMARLVRALDMTVIEFFRRYDLEGSE
ncbi:MAG: helix-turn-helix transcriptional regulator [Phycisphaeraceae bacterium]|nr:MAG: helix-turn-helix transcriptional regulator [Phycisphaeraceae bacterium]